MSSLNSQTNIKFLFSYGGKILPRNPDGKLRYHGGETRLLSVDRSISYSDLMMKTAELYGGLMNLRCQLPTEDLDALISITSDEDLANLIEEYDRAAPVSSSAAKIRAFLSIPRKLSSLKSSNMAVNRCNRRMVKVPIYDPCPCVYHVHHGNMYLVHHGSYWKNQGELH
ncbi:uncharacterized protein LOC124913153 [Impatiens glandulifera]|uniref:uncharacterized protein LOC124913153 n=1 Tax=Impatiens glandulifera TaxID=253017 RepID=UPI001FB07A07|nr:uncharacterized protein LOC124913153 [Impatiens glandulifera]